MPANQRRLGSDKKASLLNGLELWLLEADVDEVEALSSSTLSSLLGARLFDGSSVVGAGMLAKLGAEDDERRNRLGA